MSDNNFMFTEDGSLELGIEHNNQLHFDYKIELPTIAVCANAMRAAALKFGDTTDSLQQQDLYARVATIAYSLKKLGSIEAEAITPDLLFERMIDTDLSVLEASLASLRKKRSLQKIDLKTSVPPV